MFLEEQKIGEGTKQRTRKRYKEFKENYEMKSIHENNNKKIGRKHKTWSTKFLSLFVICELRKQKKQSKYKYFLIWNSKYRYMMIDT